MLAHQLNRRPPGLRTCSADFSRDLGRVKDPGRCAMNRPLCWTATPRGVASAVQSALGGGSLSYPSLDAGPPHGLVGGGPNGGVVAALSSS